DGWITESIPASGLRLPEVLPNVRIYLTRETASLSKAAQEAMNAQPALARRPVLRSSKSEGGSHIESVNTSEGGVDAKAEFTTPPAFPPELPDGFSSGVWEWQPSNEGRVMRMIQDHNTRAILMAGGIWGVTGPRRNEASQQANVTILPFDNRSTPPLEPEVETAGKGLSEEDVKKIAGEYGLNSDYNHPAVKRLIEDIEAAKFTAPYAPGAGPGSVKLTIDEVRSLYETAKLVHSGRIKIIQAQEIGLSQTMLNAFRGTKGGRDTLDCKLFSNEESLSDLLKPEEGVLKIVLTAGGRSAGIVGQLAQKEPELFRNVRSLNLDLPSDYATWGADSGKRTFYQARMAMVAIFARLYQPGKTPMVEFTLRGMLQGHIGNCDMDKFLNGLVEPQNESPESISQRIQNCLNRLVSLVEEAGEKIEHMKLEMSTFLAAA
ncbi:MAG: hypothetical protein WC419_03050, partial [Candidatus Omnitrophota bacterium]